MLRVLIYHKFVSGLSLRQSYIVLEESFVYKIFLFCPSSVEILQESVAGSILYLVFSEINQNYDVDIAYNCTNLGKFNIFILQNDIHFSLKNISNKLFWIFIWFLCQSKK